MKTSEPSQKSPLEGLLAEAEALVDSPAFSAIGAGSLTKILHTGLKALDLAALSMARTKNTPDIPIADAWITHPTHFIFSGDQRPIGLGWRAAENDCYWMLRTASLIVPGWLKAGSRLTFHGKGLASSKTEHSFTVHVGKMALRAQEKPSFRFNAGNPLKKMRKRLWQKTVTVPIDCKAALPYSILYLSAVGRGKIPDLYEDGADRKNAKGTLGLTGFTIEPPQE